MSHIRDKIRQLLVGATALRKEEQDLAEAVRLQALEQPAGLDRAEAEFDQQHHEETASYLATAERAFLSAIQTVDYRDAHRAAVEDRVVGLQTEVGRLVGELNKAEGRYEQLREEHQRTKAELEARRQAEKAAAEKKPEPV